MNKLQEYALAAYWTWSNMTKKSKMIVAAVVLIIIIAIIGG
tara:strand:- start:276 stop:398 length:123 start_codon:yes stop_codon:yes gene_type:complete